MVFHSQVKRGGHLNKRTQVLSTETQCYLSILNLFHVLFPSHKAFGEGTQSSAPEKLTVTGINGPLFAW